MNSPAAVQAALVIPWKAWAEDDATEVCHRAATLSWRRPTKEKEHVTSPLKWLNGKTKKQQHGESIWSESKERCVFVYVCLSVQALIVVYVYEKVEE